MSTFDLEEREAIESAARAWWLFLLTGLLWLLFAIIVLRFDYTTVTAVSILFGVVAIFAGVNEFFMLAASQRWWRVQAAWQAPSAEPIWHERGMFDCEKPV